MLKPFYFILGSVYTEMRRDAKMLSEARNFRAAKKRIASLRGAS